MARVEQHRNPLLERIGLYPPLAIGYLGVLFFMIGDGVESGYLAPYLAGLHFSPQRVALVFTAYGVTAAIAAWFSGGLSDLMGPKKVMWMGFAIWVVFEICFLLFGLAPQRYSMILLSYSLRGFGYPLFAYAFLVWVTAATPAKQLGTAVGWFWFAFTGGLPTLGSLFARFTIPAIGQYRTLWASLGLVILGGLIALLFTREEKGNRPLVQRTENPLRVVLESITLAWEKPKIAVGGVVRAINTTSQFGFLVFLPEFFVKRIGFTLEQWLQLLSYIFMSNIIWNLLFGVIGDRLGWRRTVAWFGGIGCAIATLALYYVPVTAGNNYPLAVLAGVFYGAVLAGYVPLSALMPSLAPEAKGAAMSILNLGAGMASWLGPGIVVLFLKPLGVAGVMWIYATLYVISFVLTLFLKLPKEMQEAAGQAG